MKNFVFLSMVVAVAVAKPSYIVPPHLNTLTYASSIPALVNTANVGHVASSLVQAAPVAVNTVPVIAAPITSQYHSQDTFGQYSFGYASPLSSKTETKTIDGITRGGYTYLDANGQVQTISYVSDALNGFRVAATNLPVAPSHDVIAPIPVRDTPEVEAAKAAHLATKEEATVNSENAADPDTDTVAVDTVAAKTATEEVQHKANVAVAAAPVVQTKISGAQPHPSSFSYTSYITHHPSAFAIVPHASVVAAAPAVSSVSTSIAPVATPVEAAPAASVSDNVDTVTIEAKSDPAPAAVSVASIPTVGLGVIQGVTYTSGKAVATPVLSVASAPFAGLGVIPNVAYTSGIHTTKIEAKTVPISAPVVATAQGVNVGVVPGITLTAIGVPVDTPEVAQAKAAHLAAVEAVKVQTAW